MPVARVFLEMEPGENATAVAGMAASATRFEMSFVIRLNSVAFRASLADPLLVVTVFPSEVFLDSYKISECVTRVVVETRRLRTDVNSLLHFLVVLSLKKLPWNFMSSPVHL